MRRRLGWQRITHVSKESAVKFYKTTRGHIRENNYFHADIGNEIFLSYEHCLTVPNAKVGDVWLPYVFKLLQTASKQQNVFTAGMRQEGLYRK
jgi:hypothetical protein